LEIPMPEVWIIPVCSEPCSYKFNESSNWWWHLAGSSQESL